MTCCGHLCVHKTFIGGYGKIFGKRGFQMYKQIILIVPIALFMAGCSDTTDIETKTPKLTYTYLKCEDKDESWKEDRWNERPHWANLVLKIHSDSQTAFHNGPNSVWLETTTISWDTNEISLYDEYRCQYFYENCAITFDSISINRESLNATRAMERKVGKSKYFRYGCEIMSEAESADYEDTFAKTREELVRKSKEKEEEQKKKNKI